MSIPSYLQNQFAITTPAQQEYLRNYLQTQYPDGFRTRDALVALTRIRRTTARTASADWQAIKAHWLVANPPLLYRIRQGFYSFTPPAN